MTTIRDLMPGDKCTVTGRDGVWIMTYLKGYAEKHKKRGPTGLAPMEHIFVNWDTGQALAFTKDTEVELAR